MNIVSKQKKWSNIITRVTLLTAVSLLKTVPVNAFSIDFDYTYDTNNFFDPNTTAGQDRRNTLTQAGQYYTNYISDSLSAIENNSSSRDGIGFGSNTWTASFFHPGTGNQQTIADLTVPADTITIYAGGRDFSSLGLGGTGGFTTASGTQEFVDLIKGRGQAGALTDPETDIGLWGGSIAFDTNIVVNVNDTPTNFDWHNIVEPTQDDTLESNEFDFLSVALHELAHVFGYTSNLDSSWGSNISSGTNNFTGANSLAVYQAESAASATFVPLENGSLSHWQNGTDSFTLAGDLQETALDPNIANGQRKYLTNLDYAGLEDIGWDVNTATVPFEFSPSLGILVVAGMFGTKKAWNARKS